MKTRRDWLKSSALLLGGHWTMQGASEYAQQHALHPIFQEGYVRPKEGGLIKLSANENPYGISPKAREAVLQVLQDGSRYVKYETLRQKVATLHQIQSNQVWMGAGSSDLLTQSLLALKKSGGNIVCGKPTFPVLPDFAKKLGIEVREIALTTNKLHDLEAMAAAVDANTTMVYICNPHNPTGTLLPAQQLRDFAREMSKKTWVFVDEAYIDFLDNPAQHTVLPLMAENPRIFVSRTFSKIHGMAGMRFAFLVGHTSFIDQLSKALPTWPSTLSQPGVACALATLEDTDYLRFCKEKNTLGNQLLAQRLQELNIHFIPSVTNFCYVSLEGFPGDLSQKAQEAGFEVRGAKFYNENWGRISIGTEAEMRQFVAAVPRIWGRM
jgi:histidinol-phosphate aminotransferase